MERCQTAGSERLFGASAGMIEGVGTGEGFKEFAFTRKRDVPLEKESAIDFRESVTPQVIVLFNAGYWTQIVFAVEFQKVLLSSETGRQVLLFKER